MSGHAGPGEYDGEPVHGLPETPPPGEAILWQGSPDARSLARRAFHTRKVAAYFALLAGWSAASSYAAATPWSEAVVAAGWLVLLGGAVVGLLTLIAWLHSRATVYTLTSRRVVIRHGVAVEMAVNLPFGVVQSAAHRDHGDGTGDLVLAPSGVGELGYFMLWPHARPGHFGEKAEPMLRCVPDSAAVAAKLARALAASAQPRAVSAPEAAERPRRAPVASALS